MFKVFIGFCPFLLVLFFIMKDMMWDHLSSTNSSFLKIFSLCPFYVYISILYISPESLYASSPADSNLPWLLLMLLSLRYYISENVVYFLEGVLRFQFMHLNFLWSILRILFNPFTSYISLMKHNEIRQKHSIFNINWKYFNAFETCCINVINSGSRAIISIHETN